MYNEPMKILKAKVTKILLTQPYDELPKKVNKAELFLDGLKHDRHFGATRLAGVREVALVPKGVETRNLRAVSIVSEEELKEISKDMGAEATAEDLEANITLSGFKNLTQLLPGSYIRFPRSAVLFVTGENFPCVIPSQHMMARGMDKMKAIKFAKAALHKRGLVAMPFVSGVIKEGDEVEIILPGNFE